MRTELDVLSNSERDLFVFHNKVNGLANRHTNQGTGDDEQDRLVGSEVVERFVEFREHGDSFEVDKRGKRFDTATNLTTTICV